MNRRRLYFYSRLPFYALRLCRILAFSLGRVRVRSFKQYIGKNCRIEAERGWIQLDRRCTLADRVSLIAFGKGVITLGAEIFINESSRIVAMERIDVGDNCLIGDSVSIYDHDHAHADPHRLIRKQGYVATPVRIGRNVWICSHVVVCKGVSIGDNSVIGAGSVVTHSIPADVVAVGAPARVVKRRY